MPLGTYLNGSAPQNLRGLMLTALSDTGNVLAGTSLSDGGGGATQSWTAGAAVPCRIDPLGGGGPGELADRVDERSTHLVIVPSGTSVSSADRFVISGRGTFEVTATRTQTAGLASMFEVLEIS